MAKRMARPGASGVGLDDPDLPWDRLTQMLAWMTEHGASLLDMARLHQTQIEAPALRELGDDIRRASRALAALADVIEMKGSDEPTARQTARRAVAALLKPSAPHALLSALTKRLELRAAEIPIDIVDASVLKKHAARLAALESLPESLIAIGYADEARAMRDGAHGRLPSLALRKIAEAAERFDVPSRAIARVIARNGYVHFPRLTDDKTPAPWQPTWRPADEGELSQDEFASELSAAIERWGLALDQARYDLRQSQKNRAKRRRSQRK